MDFRPLNETERRQLITALRGNADRGRALLDGPPGHQLRRHRRRGARRGGDQRHQVGPVPLLSSGSGQWAVDSEDRPTDRLLVLGSSTATAHCPLPTAHGSAGHRGRQAAAVDRRGAGDREVQRGPRPGVPDPADPGRRGAGAVRTTSSRATTSTSWRPGCSPATRRSRPRPGCSPR